MTEALKDPQCSLCQNSYQPKPALNYKGKKGKGGHAPMEHRWVLPHIGL